MKFKRIKVQDRQNVEFTTQEITPEGFLKAQVALTTVGIQEYYGDELGLEPSDKAFKIFRGPDTVFHPDTLASGAMKPVVRDHPTEDVSPENYRRLAVGHLGETIGKLDESRIGTAAIIFDAATIKEIQEKKRSQTSSGYGADIVMEPGVWQGDEYDGHFDGPMYINHLACVERGRCGPNVGFFDSEGNRMKIKFKDLKKVLDGAGVKYNADYKDDDEISSEQFAKLLKDAVKQPEPKDNTEEFASMLKDAMAGMGKKESMDADPYMMLAKMMKYMMGGNMDGYGGMKKTDAKPEPKPEPKNLDDAVAHRVKLLADAAPMLADDFNADGKTDREIMVAALGDKFKVDDSMTDDYIRGIFAERAATRAKANDAMQNGFNDAGSTPARPCLNAVELRKLNRRKGGK